MTDPEIADRTYVEPLTLEGADTGDSRREAPPTRCCPRWGGQDRAQSGDRGSNKAGVLAKVRACALIGAQIEAIEKAEDRELFQEGDAEDRPLGAAVGLRALAGRGEDHPGRDSRRPRGVGLSDDPAAVVSRSAARARPIAWNGEEFDTKVQWGLSQSPRGEVLIEQSVIGWKEYELEVHARPQRQRGHHLLDRELRSDGACTPAIPSPSRRR